MIFFKMFLFQEAGTKRGSRPVADRMAPVGVWRPGGQGVGTVPRPGDLKFREKTNV